MKSNLHPRDTALLVKITHTKPIEIKDFVAMMGAVGGLFDGFCKSNGDSTEAQKANLYVQKIKHGSIEIFLTEAISAIALPFIENMNLVMEFAGHIKSVVEYFTKGVGEKPQLSLKELRQFHDIFAVTAGDNKGSTEIGAVHKDCSGAMHNAHTVQDVGEDGNEDVVKRALHLAHCATIEMLYPFTKSEIVATEVDNRLEEKETYDITLNVPIGFSQTTITLLESLIHNWMVYRATYEWMLLTYPDKAPLWQQRMTETEIEIEKHLTMRRGRIHRHTTPF